MIGGAFGSLNCSQQDKSLFVLRKRVNKTIQVNDENIILKNYFDGRNKEQHRISPLTDDSQERNDQGECPSTIICWNNFMYKRPKFSRSFNI